MVNLVTKKTLKKLRDLIGGNPIPTYRPLINDFYFVANNLLYNITSKSLGHILKESLELRFQKFAFIMLLQMKSFRIKQ